MSLSLLNQTGFIKFKLDNSNDEYVLCKYARIKDPIVAHNTYDDT